MEPSSAHPESSTAINDHESEASKSEHSFESNGKEEVKADIYYSTSLVTRCNITLADVICELVTTSMLHNRHQALVHKCRFLANHYGIIDPRGVFKDAKRHGAVFTLVPYDKVLTLAQQAVEVRLAFERKMHPD